jgi:hypothetical protein
MADGYNPGDIIIDSFSVSSSRGSLDLSTSFVSASIFESIFTPGIIGDIIVFDTDDQLGQLKITGDEMVELSFKAPGGESANYKFALHALDDLNSNGSQKSKSYTLKVVSEEALHSKTNFVQKSYNTAISDMVKDIHKNYMKSEKPLEVEETKGKQKIILGHYAPYKATDLVRRRSISNENKSSSYVFFETRSGGNQTFKFTTIEKLFKGETVKEFQQSDALNSSIMNKTDNNIIAYEVPKQFSATDRIETGGKRRVTSFDVRTHTYKTKDVDTKSTDYKTGGTGSYDSSEFKSKYFNAKIPPQSVIPVDTSQRPITSIPDQTADQQAFLATLMQNAIKIKVYGDANLKAGDMVNANIPNKVSTTGNGETDPLLSGKFLVSRIHHQIGTAGERPRYTCVMELLKGNLEKGVS